jgi:hypothetical protein
MNGHDRNLVNEKRNEHHDWIGIDRHGAWGSAAEDEAHSRLKVASQRRRQPGPKKTAGKLAAERSNKKAEVIAMMKRAKGATLTKIIAPESSLAR